MEQSGKQVNWKKLAGIIAGVATFYAAYFGIQQLFFKPASFDKVLMATASELNKTLPMMVDQETRLDNAVALPNNTFQYNYTLVNYDKTEIDIDTVRKYVEPGVINNVKSNPGLKTFRENRVTMDYYYKDKNGVFVLKISVTPDMYVME